MAYELVSPLTPANLARLGDRRQLVQFSTPLSEADYSLLGGWIKDRPLIALRACDGSITNLDFLRWFPHLKRFIADMPSLDSLNGLRYLPDDLETLGLGATRKRLSLRPIARFSEMRALGLEGHTKDIDAVEGLTALVALGLRSVTLPSLDVLQTLERLQALDLTLGGTKNLSALPAIGRLRYLELWHINGLTDISSAAKLPDLEYLHLQSLTRVERLPDFSEAHRLGRVWIETLKGLTDLASLVSAPSIEHVALVNMGHLPPEALRPLVASPTLRSVRVGLGSGTKNRRAQEILGALADPDGEVWNEVWNPDEYLYRGCGFPTSICGPRRKS